MPVGTACSERTARPQYFMSVACIYVSLFGFGNQDDFVHNTLSCLKGSCGISHTILGQLAAFNISLAVRDSHRAPAVRVEYQTRRTGARKGRSDRMCRKTRAAVTRVTLFRWILVLYPCSTAPRAAADKATPQRRDRVGPLFLPTYVEASPLWGQQLKGNGAPVPEGAKKLP